MCRQRRMGFLSWMGAEVSADGLAGRLRGLRPGDSGRGALLRRLQPVDQPAGGRLPGLRVAATAIDQTGRCATCRRVPFPFAAATSGFEYGEALAEALVRMKHGGRRDLGRRLARLLAQPMAEALARGQFDSGDAVVPVPLHPSKLRARGFNQALELARWALAGLSAARALSPRADPAASGTAPAAADAAHAGAGARRAGGAAGGGGRCLPRRRTGPRARPARAARRRRLHDRRHLQRLRRRAGQRRRRRRARAVPRTCGLIARSRCRPRRRSRGRSACRRRR